MAFNGPWPQDPRFDPFRDAVWELSREGQVEAYLTTAVIQMRSFPFFWVKREWMWYQVNWLDPVRRADCSRAQLRRVGLTQAMQRPLGAGRGRPI